MSRVKICGITSSDDRDHAVNCGADAVGFIAGEIESPRAIEPKRAALLVTELPPLVSSVLVIMPDQVSEAIEITKRVEPDTVQVHELSPDEVDELARDTSASVISAVTVDAAPQFEGVGDALLVDSLDEDGQGGTGSTHDWARTRDLVTDLDTPVILAGGLTPENVARAIETVRPYGVDVATGVERSGGVKDPEAVRSFIEHARRANPNAHEATARTTDGSPSRRTIR